MNLIQLVQRENNVQIVSSIELSHEQMELLYLLNKFAVHQAQYNAEVRQFPAKITYKVNDELKLGLVALLTTCSMLDPKRRGIEEQFFFDNELKIKQNSYYTKFIDFGRIRPQLVQQSVMREILEDWFLYRDVNGDGVHALMDRKTYLQGLSKYVRGGPPVYEFARFYRRFMENKLAKKLKRKERAKDYAIRTLTDQMIRHQLDKGQTPQSLLEHLFNDEDVLSLDSVDEVKMLPKE